MSILEKAVVWVLNRTTNPGVGGSNPSARAIQTSLYILYFSSLDSPVRTEVAASELDDALYRR